MGVYDCDLISGDSQLEFAMDLLDRAGIGPHNYAERKKVLSLVISDIGSKKFVGRHSPEEYEEYWECFDAAADMGETLQLRLKEMLTLCNSIQFLKEGSLDKGGDEDGIVGLAIHVLILILMQAGVLPKKMHDDIMSGRLGDIWSRPIPQRAAHFANFVEAARKYVPPRYDHVKANVEATPDGTVKVHLWPMLRGTAVSYRPQSLFDKADHDYSDAIKDNLAKVTSREVVLRHTVGFKIKSGPECTTEELRTVHAQNAVERERNPAMYHDDKHQKQENDPHGLIAKNVSLSGLLSRIDLNGSTGIVRAYDKAASRYSVELDSRPGQRLAIKHENLILIDAPEVQ